MLLNYTEISSYIRKQLDEQKGISLYCYKKLNSSNRDKNKTTDGHYCYTVNTTDKYSDNGERIYRVNVCLSRHKILSSRDNTNSFYCTASYLIERILEDGWYLSVVSSFYSDIVFNQNYPDLLTRQREMVEKLDKERVLLDNYNLPTYLLPSFDN